MYTLFTLIGGVFGAVLFIAIIHMLLERWKLRQNTSNRKLLLRFFENQGVPKSTWMGEYTTEWKLKSGVKVYLNNTGWWAVLYGRRYITPRLTGWRSARDHKFIEDLLGQARKEELNLTKDKEQENGNDTAE